MKKEELVNYVMASDLVYHLDFVDEKVNEEHDLYLLVSNKDDTSDTKYFIGVKEDNDRMIDYSLVVAGPKGIELIDEDKDKEVVAYLTAVTTIKEFHQLLASGTDDYSEDYDV